MIIKKIKIQNFNNWKNVEIEFNEKETIICAPTGFGKTSIKQAFDYVLGIDKKSTDITPSIKKNGEEKVLLTSETPSVEMFFEINGIDYTLLRSKKMEINGIKYTTLKSYTERVKEILNIDLNVVKDLSLFLQVGLFNSDTSKWKWNDRQTFLYKLFGIDKKLNELAKNEKYNLVKEYIEKSNGYTDTSKTLKNERKVLESKIDFLNNNLQQLEEEKKEINFDYETLKKELENLQQAKKNSHEPIAEAVEQNKITREKINALEEELIIKDTQYRSTKNALLSKYNQLNATLNQMVAEIKVKQAEFNAKKESFNTTSFEEICSKCGQKIAFNQEKEIERKEKLKAEIIDLQAVYNDLKNNYNNTLITYSEIKTQIANLQDDFTDIYLEKINNLKSSFVKEFKSNDSFDNDIQMLQQKVFNEQRFLRVIEQIENSKLEIKKITKKLFDLAKAESELEYFFEDSLKIQDSINANFKNVIFSSSYKTQKGDLKQEMEIVYNGSYYNGMCSTGERLYCDLEIIEVLQNKVGINLPIWIDDAQDITLKLDTKRQVIKLVTTENVEKINIDGERFK